MPATLNGLIEKMWTEMQFKMQDIMNWACREDKALWHYSSYLAAKYTIWIKYKKGKFRIKLLLIELYTVGKIIKLTF